MWRFGLLLGLGLFARPEDRVLLDEPVTLWQPSTTPLSWAPAPIRSLDDADAAGLAPDGTLWWSEGDVLMAAALGGEARAMLALDEPLWGIDVSDDGQSVALATAQEVTVLDATTLQATAALAMPEKKGGTRYRWKKLTLSGDGTALIRGARSGRTCTGPTSRSATTWRLSDSGPDEVDNFQPPETDWSRIQPNLYKPSSYHTAQQSRDDTWLLLETGVDRTRTRLIGPFTDEAHHPGMVTTEVALEGSGRWLAAGSGRAVIVWDLQTGEPRVLETRDGWLVDRVQWDDRDGRLLVLWKDALDALDWDTSHGPRALSIHRPADSPTLLHTWVSDGRYITDAELHPDGGVVVSNRRGVLWVGGEAGQRKLTRTRAEHLTVSADGRLLAFPNGSSVTIQAINHPDQVEATIDLPENFTIEDLRFAGRALWMSREEEAFVYNLDTHALRQAQAPSVIRKGRQVARARGQTPIVFDKSALHRSCRGDHAVYRNGVWAVEDEGTIRVCTDDGRPARTLTGPLSKHWRVHRSPDGSALAFLRDDTGWVWSRSGELIGPSTEEAAAWERLKRPDWKDDMPPLDLSRDERWLAHLDDGLMVYARRDGVVYLHDADAAAPYRALLMPR